jgi:hypothetical protein
LVVLLLKWEEWDLEVEECQEVLVVLLLKCLDLADILKCREEEWGSVALPLNNPKDTVDMDNKDKVTVPMSPLNE